MVALGPQQRIGLAPQSSQDLGWGAFQMPQGHQVPPTTGPGGVPQAPAPGRRQAAMGRIADFLTKNPNMLMALGSGLLDHRANANNTIGSAVRLGMQGGMVDRENRKEEEAEAEEEAQLTATEEWLIEYRNMSPEEARATVRAGMVGEALRAPATPEWKVVGDQLVRIDPGATEPAWHQAPGGGTTDDIDEYEYYANSERDAGRQPLPFLDWETSRRRAGASQVNVGQSEYGTIPQGYELFTDPAGARMMRPIPGGPAALEADQAADASSAGEQRTAQTGNVVVQDIDRALATISDNPNMTTGVGGSLTSWIPGSPGHNVDALIDTVRANAGFRELQAMREASPTGGALGNVTERELAFLQSAIGNLSQSQGREQLADNLRRVKNLFLDIIHGPGQGPQRDLLGFETGLPADVTEEDIEHTMRVHGLSREEVLERLR